MFRWLSRFKTWGNALGVSYRQGTIGHPVERYSLASCIRRPVQGAKKDGVKGFVKGVGSGIVSGVVKGVSGITEPGCSSVIVIASGLATGATTKNMNILKRS